MINNFHAPGYEFLSNFYTCPVTFEHVTYPSAENAYQASKTLDLTARKQFETCTAGQAKRLGRTLVLRPNFNQAKVTIMYDILRNKFGSSQELMRKLLATGSEELVEGNVWHDTFWGVCDGKGQNMLGKMLMHLRRQIQEKAYISVPIYSEDRPDDDAPYEIIGYRKEYV